MAYTSPYYTSPIYAQPYVVQQTLQPTPPVAYVTPHKTSQTWGDSCCACLNAFTCCMDTMNTAHAIKDGDTLGAVAGMHAIGNNSVSGAAASMVVSSRHGQETCDDIINLAKCLFDGFCGVLGCLGKVCEACPT